MRDDIPYAEVYDRLMAAERQLAGLWALLDCYFDLALEDSWDDCACPEPEDVWRLHRDLRAYRLRAGWA